MPNRARYLAEQRAMIMSLGTVVVDSLLGHFQSRQAALPGPELSLRVAPPSDALIDDFLRHVGGHATDYAALIPPQLFPQWGLAAALRALRGCGYPLIKLVNGGCRLESYSPLRRDRPLSVRARLESVSADSRRAVLCQRVVTEQDGAPSALVAEIYGIVRHATGRPRDPEVLPPGARELATWRLERDAGLTFALLTGDFNPVHWLPAYARAFGFRSTILHGFAAMARVHTGLEGALGHKLRVLDLRFVRPITLPARVSLHTLGERVFLSSGSDLPCVTGSFAS